MMADSSLTTFLRALVGEAHAAPPPQYPSAPQSVAGDIYSQQLDPHTRLLYNQHPLAPPPTTTTLPATAPGLQPPTDPNGMGQRVQAAMQQYGTLSSSEALELNAKQARQIWRERQKLVRGQLKDLHGLLRTGSDPGMADTILQSLLDSGAVYEDSPGEVGTVLNAPLGGPRDRARFLDFLRQFSQRTGQVPMPNPYIPRVIPPQYSYPPQ